MSGEGWCPPVRLWSELVLGMEHHLGIYRLPGSTPGTRCVRYQVCHVPGVPGTRCARYHVCHVPGVPGTREILYTVYTRFTSPHPRQTSASAGALCSGRACTPPGRPWCTRLGPSGGRLAFSIGGHGRLRSLGDMVGWRAPVPPTEYAGMVLDTVASSHHPPTGHQGSSTPGCWWSWCWW